MTYGEVRAEVMRMLRAAGIENEAAESLLLMEHACGTDRTSCLLREEEVIEAGEREAYFALAEKRCERIPLQYLTGGQEFMGLPFRVDRRVLIPRQDTEILAEQALKVLTAREDFSRVLDLCTGSGCLAVSIKALCPRAEVTASDISADALAVAAENAAGNGADVRFIESDLFARITGSYDLIVSNPPYIPSGELSMLMPEVRDYEPRLALDGEEDGLAFYRKIARQSGEYLRPGGYLLLETGCDQGAAVSALLRAGGYADIRVIPDLAGLDRVVSGRKESEG